MRLYELSEQYSGLIDMLEQEPDNEALQGMLNGLEGKIEDKVDAVLSVRNAKRAEVKAIREEAQRLSGRAAQIEHEANRLEQMVENVMNQSGLEKLKTLKFTTWLQLGPPGVTVTDESKLPEYYFNSQPDKLDRKRLMEDIKNGVYNRPEVAVIEQIKSLRVR
jgi:hypothetical protein